MKIILTQLSSYHLWANHLINDRINKLPDAIKCKEVPSSFPGIRNTLLHMWDAESIWWQRMKLQEVIVPPSNKQDLSCDEIVTGIMQQSKQWHEWVLAAQEHMYDHEFIYHNSKKEKFKQPVYQVLIHVFNHATYHRGQLVTILRQLEVGNIPETDFIVWSRKK